MNIAVFGLGYVGTVSAACLANEGHNVYGVDINPAKIEPINSGQSPIVEANVAEIIEQAVAEKRLRATTEASTALAEADVSLVCVGTPVEASGAYSMKAVKRACQDIAQHLASMSQYHVVVIRSTILPGTMDDIIVPLLEAESGLVAGEDFGICFNPEFLREGSAVKDFRHPPFTLIGGSDERALNLVEEIYQGVEGKVIRAELKTAETVKFVSNAFHALKITFANEIGNVCKQYGIDSHKVMDIFCQDTKLNISPAYLKPGFAFGGSCLPKDLHALLYMGRRADLKLPVLEAVLPSNAHQVNIGLDMVMATGKKKIGVLGFSFKEGTDDLRYSAQVELIERLIGKGYQVKLYDRNVSLARLHGANKEYIESEIPHIATLMCDSVDAVLESSEVVVIGNKDEAFRDVLTHIRDDQVVVDLMRITEDFHSLNGQYQGICW